MPVRRDKRTGGWVFQTTVKKADGARLRIFGTPGVPGLYHDLPRTRVGAQEAERRVIAAAISGTSIAQAVRKEVPTFAEWFTGRFWREWVVGRRNKPTEVKSKEQIFKLHLRPAFGHLELDKIRTRPHARAEDAPKTRGRRALVPTVLIDFVSAQRSG